jgi:predicted AAA+ superfamily ATPase
LTDPSEGKVDRKPGALPIVWLTGPPRVGKTVLAQSLPETEFLNCDLPSTAERLHDPERFYAH